MGTVNFHGLRARRVEAALRAKGVRDVKVTFHPSAVGSTKDELTGRVCDLLEAYLDGKAVVVQRGAAR
jgi:hypothetical protein